MTAAQQIPVPEGVAPPKKRRTKQARRLPIYVMARIMVDPDTQLRKMAFVAANNPDRMICKERGYKPGDMLRGDFTKPRNPKFNGLVHGLGTLVRRHVDGYHDCKDAHDVIKRLQRQSGVCCEVQEIDANPIVEAFLAASQQILGEVATRMLATVLPSIKKLNVTVAQSLAFDCMDEAEFHAFWNGICTYLIEHHWHDLDPDTIEEMAGLVPEVET